MNESLLTRRDLLPSLSSLLGVLVLFLFAHSLTRAFEPQIVSAVSDHGVLGLAIFFATTALAVVFPVFTNLPLVPLAVLLWGSWWTALVMFLGWIAGSTLSFALARRFKPAVAKAFPAVARYTDIDRLILPSRPVLSLVLLRMTFPVDMLSYVLGLFSTRATARQNLISTAVGVAPFALLFAFLPALPLSAQSAFLVASALVFVVYLLSMRSAVGFIRLRAHAAAGPTATPSERGVVEHHEPRSVPRDAVDAPVGDRVQHSACATMSIFDEARVRCVQGRHYGAPGGSHIPSLPIAMETRAGPSARRSKIGPATWTSDRGVMTSAMHRSTGHSSKVERSTGIA
jgi:uncharacterized membrane protein YdjX (TVP38/TMEM64 family)